MTINKFIRSLLNLKELSVSHFELQVRRRTLNLWVKPYKNGCLCPHCKRRGRIAHITDMCRIWRDLPVYGVTVLLWYCPKEILCPTHGRVQENIPWADTYSRVTYRFEFGEWSRDCPNGFDENDVCRGEESNEGSWEAGKPPMDDPDGVIARPGLIMTGTPLLGSKYFQEIAPPDAVDRGEIREMGLDVDEWSGCIKIIDTNPAEGACGDDDSKIYCPGVGLVQDQDLELVWYGFVGCDDDDDDDDDSNHHKRWRRNWR